MGIPIFVLAGQSNAVAIENEMIDQLNDRYGVGNYRLVSVCANGAPLTYSRAAQDWASPTELRATLVDQTVQMLRANPSGQIAGIIWLQGEADTVAVARAAEYQSRLTTLIDDFRSAVDAATGTRATGIDTANFVISSLSVQAPMATNRSNWTTIIEAQHAITDTRDNIRLVDPDSLGTFSPRSTEGMFRDLLHYSNSFADRLANALISAAVSPDDTLHGTLGADRMAGGNGDDLYIVNNPGDRIVELRDAGTDTVRASVSYSLLVAGVEVENLTLTGTADINGIGNWRSNVLQGNAGNNRLSGNFGADAIFGMAGDDVLNGGNGCDTLFGGAGNDTLVGAQGRDEFWGGAGADTFVMADRDVWRERVMDFENGIDLLNLHGTGVNGMSDLTMVTDVDGIVVNYGAASFQLVGISVAQLDASDFVF